MQYVSSWKPMPMLVKCWMMRSLSPSTAASMTPFSSSSRPMSFPVAGAMKILSKFVAWLRSFSIRSSS